MKNLRESKFIFIFLIYINTFFIVLGIFINHFNRRRPNFRLSYILNFICILAKSITLLTISITQCYQWTFFTCLLAFLIKIDRSEIWIIISYFCRFSLLDKGLLACYFWCTLWFLLYLSNFRHFPLLDKWFLTR